MEACMFRKDTPTSSTTSSEPTMRRPTEPRVETVIGDGTRISGEIKVDGDIRVDGEVEGLLTVSGNVAVGRSGVVKADVESTNAEISGRVVGKISARERVVLLGASRLEGDVQAASFKIEDGAFFQGNCVMGGDRQKRAASSESEEEPRIKLAKTAKG
jgi:cytoskeletal protein CcmA (bactofilin family)